VLDATDKGIVVSNNGPQISERVVDRIFELGYSQKPNGRGMGLYIVRKTLQRDRWDIKLLPSKHSNDTSFLLSAETKES
jgi:signal transduction histidine kinase